MKSTDPIDVREAELTKIAASKADVAALRKHVADIVEGPAFKGSHRSGQFLRYIVEQAIAGNFESLKERVIGVELFRRSPSYITSEDAIVRVTASEVRKRLLQHYGHDGMHSTFRISLPLGSYIPEVTRERRNNDAPQEQHGAPDSAIEAAHIAPPARPAETSVAEPHPEIPARKSLAALVWLSAIMLIIGVASICWAALHNNPLQAGKQPAPILPWSTLFHSQHAVQVITSDPNIAEIQGFTGGQISVSDYANHNYMVGPKKLTPEEEYFCRTVLRGNKSATIDTQIAVSIAGMAQANSSSIDVRGARDIQLSDLKTNNNYILIGSPRSNPWVSLFSDQLGFQFVFDTRVKSEYILNTHPRPGEKAQYVPTAVGWTTGDSYAVIAMVQNPDQDGHVLLLAGANGEGTEAAGKLAADLPRLSSVLQQCGIAPTGHQKHFELLLHLNTMAGAPNKIDIAACRILPS